MLSRRFIAPLLAVAAFVAPAVSVVPAAHAAKVPAMTLAVIDHDAVTYDIVVVKAGTPLTIVNASGVGSPTYTLTDGSNTFTSQQLAGEVYTVTPTVPSPSYTLTRTAPSAPAPRTIAQVIVI
jgi:hypothetical protein